MALIGRPTGETQRLIEDLWYRAQESPVGIEITSSNPKTLVNSLYRVRKSMDDPLLESFSITLSPADPSKVWVVRAVSKKDLYEREEES
jgi:hypothetical protein